MADDEQQPTEEPPPEEAPPPAGGEEPLADEIATAEGDSPATEAPPDEAPPAEETAGQEAQQADASAEAETGESPSDQRPPQAQASDEPDYLHDPEIEVLEADGIIEDVHMQGQTEPGQAPKEEGDELDDEETIEEGDEFDESQSTIKDGKKVSLVGIQEDADFFGKSKSVMEILKDSSMDLVTKKELLEKKKQKVLGSIISIRRGDPTYFDRQKVPKYQNSYKLDSDKPFNHEKVEQILQEVLKDALHDLTYDHDKCAKQAKWASSAIRAKVKEQEYERYKIICYVSIGEKLCQDIFTMLRFLWDQERDRYAIYVHETMNLFGIGLCFGIYYE